MQTRCIDGESKPLAARTARRFRRWFAFLAAAVIVLAAIPSEIALTNPLAMVMEFSSLSHVSPRPDGGMLAIDSARKRILSIGPDGTLETVIHGGTRAPEGFFYATEAVATEDGSIIIVNWTPDELGFFLTREAIIRFDASGQFVDVLHEVALDSPLQAGYKIGLRPLSCGLSADSGTVRWLETQADGVVVRHVDIASGEAGAEPQRRFPGANIGVLSADIGPDRLIVCHKNGVIYDIPRDGEATRAYSADASERKTPDGVPAVPLAAILAPDGGVYYTDVAFREIRKAADGASETVLSMDGLGKAFPLVISALQDSKVDPDEVYFPRLRVDRQGGIVTFIDNAIVTLPAGGGPENARVLFDASLPAWVRMLAALSWIALAAALLSIPPALWFLYVDFFGREFPDGLKTAALCVILVALTLAVVLPPVISKMVADRVQAQEQRISLMLQTMPALVDGDLIDRLDGAEDFMNDDYRALRGQVHKLLLDRSAPWNQGSYCAIHRLFDDRIYAMMYLNDEVGLFFPPVWTDSGLYRDTLKNGGMVTGRSEDADGTWIYGFAPIRNSRGGIAAVFETGADLYVMNTEIRSMAKNAVIGALTLLGVFLLIAFEGVFLKGLLKKLRLARARCDIPPNEASPYLLARPAACLFFFAASLPTVFIPLYMSELYSSGSWLGRDMAMAAPLSLQMLFSILAIPFATGMVRRFGAKAVVHLGIAISAAGYLAAWSLESMIGFMLSCSAIGFGTGTGFIAIRGFLFGESDARVREIGYSHFYSGMTAGCYIGMGVGASLAHAVGYHRTFLFSLGLLAFAWALTAFFILPLIPDAGTAGTGADERPRLRDVLRYLSSKRISGFLVLHLLPVYMLSSYVFYYFPVFAEESGLDVSEIGGIMLLHGFFVIYAGTAASEFLLARVSPARITYFGQLGWCAGITVAALTSGIIAAVAVLLFFALVEGVCVAGENAHLMRLEETLAFGEARAVAVNEIVGKAGETIGPLLFASALALGRTGIAGMGVAGAVLGTIYLAGIRRGYPRRDV